MAEERVQRRLAAILAADVVGYSRLMGQDETGTRARFNAHLHSLIEPAIALHRGRIVKTTGDALLVEFTSVVDAVGCAVEVQDGMAERNADQLEDLRMDFRIGINLGDVIIEGDDIHGDGVNVASRLEGLAEPGGIVVSGKVHDEVQDKTDLSFSNLGLQQVKNIARPVPAYAADMKPMRATVDAEPLPLPDKPSVAVLPFNNMSGDPEQEYFADGITEDIITGLSRVRWIFVIARNTTFTYKGQSVDVQDLSRNLGVRYVLEGSVRKAGGLVRVTAQLIDGSDGNHLWAEKYDRDLADIFEVQDEITQTVVGAIVPEMAGAERERARGNTTESLNAWDAFQRGKEQYYKYSVAGFEQALDYFGKAIQLDPKFAQAFAAIADIRHRQFLFGYSKNSDEILKIGLDAAHMAVELDSGDAEAHAALGLVVWSSREIDEAISALKTSIDLNPSYAFAHSALGMVLGAAGSSAEAVEHHLTAMRLSPRDPELFIMLSRCAFTHTIAQDHERAVEMGKKAIRLSNSRLWLPFAQTATALAHLGRLDEARQMIDRLLALKSDVTIDLMRTIFIFADAADQESYLDGLRKAGLPE